MMKMLIEFDREKILREQQYNLEDMEKYIEKMFAIGNMHRDEEGIFGIGDFSSIGAIVSVLSKKEWFTGNVKRWIWYDSGFDDSENPRFSEEDLMLSYCNKAS